MQRGKRGPLFDDLIGALLENQGHIETERLGGLQVDNREPQDTRFTS
jgi:hypothetical protein